MHGLLIAAAEHAPPVGHGVLLLALALVTTLGGLVRIAIKSRAARSRPDPDPEAAQDAAAPGSTR